MFFHLRFQLVERFLAGSTNMFVGGRGMQRARRQGQVEGKGVLLRTGNLGKNSMQHYQIRLIGLQKCFQLGYGAVTLLFDGIVTLYIFVADGKFHKRTCRSCWGQTGERVPADLRVRRGLESGAASNAG